MPRERAVERCSGYLGFLTCPQSHAPLWAIPPLFPFEGRWLRWAYLFLVLWVGIWPRPGQSKHHHSSWPNKSQSKSWDFYYNYWEREIFWLAFFKEQDTNQAYFWLSFLPMGRTLLEKGQNRERQPRNEGRQILDAEDSWCSHSNAWI